VTPPVPVALDPPKHPATWRVFVENPGLTAEVRVESNTARVRLRLVVRETGAVGDVQVAVSSGRPELDTAAVEAARGWRFEPARRDGVAIASTVLIWIAFVVGP
jgi:protein TonB